MNTDEQIGGSLLDIQRELIATLAERMEEITEDWRRLAETDWDAGIAADLTRLAHNLRGESALFGLNRLVGPSRELEAVLKRSIDGGGLDDGDRRTVESRLEELREACGFYHTYQLPELPAELTGSPAPASVERSPLVYVVEDDAPTAAVLAEQLGQYGFEVELFDELAKLESGLARRRPKALVMDVMLREGTLAGVEYVARLRLREGHQLPVIFISSRDDMEARLQVCRAGGDAYFTKPLRYHLVADRLDRLTGRQPSRPYEILIVDDDLAQVKHYSQALEEAGMSVSILVDPMDVLDHLKRQRPDLILLDLYMPGCSGPELAAILQQHESFLSIPVVFLSSEDDFDQQVEALGLGGEDFLTKPIDPKHLIATIRPRVERARALGVQLHRDGLTGLMTHAGQKAQLELELARAEREGREVALAMIDVDDFKSVNDEYGHAAGDRVLCSLANALKKRLRRTDMIARYGGDEFVVVLPNTQAEDAWRILEELAGSFSRLVHTAAERRFSATLSCGIASYPSWPDAPQLTSAADRALYEAKRQGKNRIVVSRR